MRLEVCSRGRINVIFYTTIFLLQKRFPFKRFNSLSGSIPYPSPLLLWGRMIVLPYTIHRTYLANTCLSLRLNVLPTYNGLLPVLDKEKLHCIRKYFSQAAGEEIPDSQTRLFGYKGRRTGYDPVDKKYHGTKVTEDPETRSQHPESQYRKSRCRKERIGKDGG